MKSHQEGVGGGLLEDVLLSLHPVDILQEEQTARKRQTASSNEVTVMNNVTKVFISLRTFDFAAVLTSISE